MLKYDIRQVYDWPQIPKLAVIGVICLILFFLGYWLDISNLKVKYKLTQQNELDLKSQYVALVNREKEMKDSLAIYPELERSLQKEKKKLILPDELPELLNDILKIGAQNGLEFSNFTPGPVEKSGDYNKVVIKANIVGSYDQIASFLSQVANLDKIVAIGNFTLSKPSPEKTVAITNAIVADLALEIYEAKPDEKK